MLEIPDIFLGWTVDTGSEPTYAEKIRVSPLGPRRFQNEAALVSYAVIKKMVVSAVHIEHCMQEMIAISSDAYQIPSCAHV